MLCVLLQGVINGNAIILGMSIQNQYKYHLSLM